MLHQTFKLAEEAGLPKEAAVMITVAGVTTELYKYKIHININNIG